MRLKYNLIHFIPTMFYVQILILYVNKDLNHANNFQWKTILYNCDFHYFRCFFSNASQKIPDNAKRATYQYTVLVHTYIKHPKVTHNAQNNSHTYCNT